ncbi:hypothetical protein [Streptomyces sp. NPDC003006]
MAGLALGRDRGGAVPAVERLAAGEELAVDGGDGVTRWPRISKNARS